MTTALRLKQIMTYAQSLAFRGVVEQCHQAIGCKLLPVLFPKLSVFINPDHFPRNKNLIFNSEVSFALFDDKRQLVLACDMLEARERAVSEKRRFLEQNGFPFGIVKVGEDIPEDFYRSLIASSAVEIQRGRRDAGSRTQLEYMRKMADVLSPDLIVLHEFSLSRLVDLDDEINFRRDFSGPLPDPNFARQSNLDAVICTAPPNAIPLLVFEVDGPSHDDPKQRIKDQFKDALLKAANIDVIRISLDKNKQNTTILPQLAQVARWFKSDLLSSPLLPSRIAGFLMDEAGRLKVLRNIRSNLISLADELPQNIRNTLISLADEVPLNVQSNLVSLAGNVLLHHRKRAMAEDVRVADAMGSDASVWYKEEDHKELSDFYRNYHYDDQKTSHDIRLDVYGEQYLVPEWKLRFIGRSPCLRIATAAHFQSTTNR